MMTGWHSRTVIVGGLCAAALLATACTGGSGGDGSDSSTRPITVLIGADVDSLDPALGSSYFARELYPLAYDTLISYDDSTQTVHSQLAQSWRITADSATFTLRKGVTCTDGTPLTASVVAANLNRIKDPKVNAPLTSTFFGSRDYTVTSDDATRTVTIKLAQPYGFLAHGFSYGPGIVCQAALNNPGELKTKSGGTGPYTLTQAVPGDHYTFTLRSGYAWGPNGATSKGLPPTVTAKVVTSEATAVNLLQGGQADLAYITSAAQLKRAEAGSFSNVSDVGMPQDLLFNERAGLAGADPTVRKALAMALDRDSLASVLSGGLAKAADSLLGEGAACNAPDKVSSAIPGVDVTGAQQLLASAGWVRTSAGTLARAGKKLNVTLLISDSVPESRAAAELVQSSWNKLGAATKIDIRPEGQANSVLFSGKGWDATIAGISSSIPATVTTLFSGPHPPNGTNFSAIDNATYSHVVGQAQGIASEAGCELWQSGERALFAAADVVPVVVTPRVWFGRKLEFKLMPFIVPTSLRTS